jgi:heme o synthase
LKRHSRQNIVIGGAAGAVPVLVGWAAVRDSLSLAPVVLFLVIFLWTPPHFWALAVRYREEYTAANVPMLPSVASWRSTTRQIVLYTLALWAASLVFADVAGMGLIYWIAALVLGGVFLWYAVRLFQKSSVVSASGPAMALFTYSISYVTLLFSAIAVDQLVRHA